MNERFGKLYQQVIISGIWAKLPLIAKSMYPVLLRYAHITTKICMPIQKTIARDSGIYWRSVPKGVKILEEHKLIKTWTMMWQGKRRIHYEILDPKTGIVPCSKDIYPSKKKQTSRVRDTRSGRFVSSALRCGTPTALPVGIKREILKRHINKDIQQYIKNTDLVDTLSSLFENEQKGQITKDEIKHTLMANWGEDPWIAEYRAKMVIAAKITQPASRGWMRSMNNRMEIKPRHIGIS